MSETQSVAVAGLGAVGGQVAAALAAGKIPGLTLAAVSARDAQKTRTYLSGIGANIPLVPLAELAALADIVVEALPASEFEEAAVPAIEMGRTLIVVSGGCLIERGWLIEKAKETGAKIMVVSGAILGLDGLRAVAEGEIERVTIKSTKPPKSLIGAPHLVKNNMTLTDLSAPLQVFAGSVRDAIVAFPANVNVAAGLSLAGIGPDRTTVEVWADPAAARVTHSIMVQAKSASFEITVQGYPSPDNPRTGMLTPNSVIAALRRLTSPLSVGS